MRGGFEVIPVKDSEFKYTTSEERKLWNKYTFPIAQYLIQAVQNMDWNSYRFEGPVQIATKWEDNDSSKPPTAYTSYRFKTSTENIVPYHFFGGCVYEILQQLFPPPFPNLRDFVDPTGDIDIHVHQPYLQIQENIGMNLSDNMRMLNAGVLKMNEFAEHYTRWILEQFHQQLLKISPILWNQMFADAEPFEPDTEDIRIQIGNVWLVRTLELEQKMVKIQLNVKYPGIPPDHLLEFVYVTGSEDVIKNKTKNYVVEMDIIKTMPLQSLHMLINGNIDSMKNRKVLHDAENRHKFYNHIGRMQYLNAIVPRFKIQANKKFQHYAAAIEAFIKFLFGEKKLGDICLYDYRVGNVGCNEREIVDKMVGNFHLCITKNNKPLPSVYPTAFQPYSRLEREYYEGHLDKFEKEHYSFQEVLDSLFPALGGARKRKTRKTRKTRKHKLRRTRWSRRK